MSFIEFKGKEFVFNHHLSLPYRPLVVDEKKSIGDGDLDGNLIVHGDNLHALKALLPTYAGKIDCVVIDPPYNTGTQSWNYNDNVNSPESSSRFTRLLYVTGAGGMYHGVIAAPARNGSLQTSRRGGDILTPHD